MTQNTERLYGVYRTAMLAGNEEFATGSFSAAYAHFNTAMVMSRRLMLLAAAGMTDVDLSVQTLMDATENASSARIRRGDTEGGFRCLRTNCANVCRRRKTILSIFVPELRQSAGRPENERLTF